MLFRTLSSLSILQNANHCLLIAEYMAEDNTINTLPAENKKLKKHKKPKHDDNETDPAAFIPPASYEHKEKKKKKKKRKVDSDCSIEEGCDSSPAKKSKFLTDTPSVVVQVCEDTETKRSKKRKHKERLVENEDGNPATSPAKCSKTKASDKVAVSTVDQDDAANCTNHADSKKKKKKASRGEKDQSEAAALQTAHDDDDSEHLGSISTDTSRSEKKRKKKHKKSKEVENCEDVENGDCSVEEMGDRQKTKRNKKSGEINVSVLSASGVAGDDDNSPIKVKKKKDKDVKKNDVDDFQSTSNNEELKECKVSFSADLLTDTMEPPKKKKSKKSKREKEGIENLCEAEYEMAHSSCDGEGKKKSKKTRKTDKRDHSEEDNSQLENGISQDCSILASEKKQKKAEELKKVKSETSTTEANTSAAFEDSCELRDVNRKEKKKKKKDLAKQLQEDCNGVPEEETVKKKNKKKKKERSESNLSTTDQSGTSTEKQQDDSSSSGTGGHTEDNQTTTSQPEQTQPVTAGQWSTRMFRSAERQEKFLRLLGGFKKGGESSMSGQKKGLFGSLQVKADSTSGGQKALTYQTARDMDKRLESDFERALAFSAKKQRGVGLGFTPDPAEGKKFHIDVNKNASRKF